MKKVLLFVILFPTFAFGNIGTVTEQHGSGTIVRDSEQISSELGSGIESMDTIVTDTGRLRLDFVDETRVDVTEHSRVVIDEFIYDPNSKQGSLGIRATLGAVRYASGQIAHNNRQRVNIATPSATISVRGTDFIMIIDEIGSSMITLLPSCNDKGMCVVGEIAVETPLGQVIMNQAFQTTVVANAGVVPKEPVILDLPETMLTSMLIVRKTTPYDTVSNQAQSSVDVLDFDFLDYTELNTDALVDSLNGLWATDLDQNNYLNEVMSDALDKLMKEMVAAFVNELDAQTQAFFEEKILGLDPDTNIFYDEPAPNYMVSRTDQPTGNSFELLLSQNYGYTLNMQQGSFSIFGYRAGVGNNTISIDQSN